MPAWAGVVLWGGQYTHPENGLPNSRDSGLAFEHQRLSYQSQLNQRTTHENQSR